MLLNIPLFGKGVSANLTSEEQAMLQVAAREREAANHQQWAIAQHMAVSNNVYARLIEALASSILNNDTDDQLKGKLTDLSVVATTAATIHMKQYGYNIVLKPVPS